jgi:hypothetical protein
MILIILHSFVKPPGQGCAVAVECRSLNAIILGIVTRFLALLLLLLLSACAALPLAAGTPTPEPTLTPTASLNPTPTIVWFPATEIPTVRPTQPPAPTPDPFTGVGEAIFTDRFRITDFFPTFRNNQGSAAYGNNEFTLALPGGGEALVSTLRKQPVLKDFYLEAEIEPSLCRGADNFGLLFRAVSEWNTYRYVLSCDGRLRVERVRNGSVFPLVDWVQSDQYPFGSVVTARLAVVAAGDELRFYVNNAYQFSVRDPIFTEGQVGLFARTTGGTALTVNYQSITARQVDPALARSTATPTVTPRPTATRAPTPTP